MRQLSKVFLCIFIGYSCSSTQKTTRQVFYDTKYEVIYSAYFIEDTIEMTMWGKDYFVLRIGDDFTHGYGYLEHYRDSLAQTPGGLYTLVQSQIETGTSYWSSSIAGAKLYKNHKEQKFSVIDNISVHFFLYEDDCIPQDWIIQADTMTIAGYICQKAVCNWRGRDWIAWFTQDIPISEGPWKFHGLPGLIVNLYDTKHHYEFELVVFKITDEKINIQPLITEEIRRFGRYTHKFIKIERKTFLGMKFGERGHIIRDIDLEKIGMSPGMRAELKYGYIELDY